jgi:hypothetical protein
MKTIIAGGRDYKFSLLDEAYLDALNAMGEITEVISGCANGADKCGETWAEKNKIPIKRFPANWKDYSFAAGPIRNKQMAEYAKGGQCILFKGGKGTDNMYRTAKELNLKIIDFRKTNNLA